MRYFFRRRIPATHRMLLIESGSRQLIERIIPPLRSMFGNGMTFDVVTCYVGLPEGVDGRVFNVNDYGGPAGRNRLLRDLKSGNYGVCGILCSAEPIMTKWKWWLGAKLPAKVLVINENADCFWLDRGHLGLIWQFITERAGLTGSAAIPAVARLLFFPLTLLYLLLYACTVHLKRRIRLL